MSRQLRIEYPGAVYHVYARGNARQTIFLDNEDRLSFLDILSDVTRQFNWLCHADCLMDNHYHLEIETPDGNLSSGMKALNGIYAQRFNIRHGRVGKLFQGRYSAKLVQKEAYLLLLCRYIVLNPVRAGMVASPEGYMWSSYRATAGLEEPHPARTTEWVLSQFGSSIADARSSYRRFVSDGMGLSLPMDDAPILGSRTFARQAVADLDTTTMPEVSRKQKFAGRPSLAEIMNINRDRDDAISVAVLDYGYTQREVADLVGLKQARISQIVKRTRLGGTED